MKRKQKNTLCQCLYQLNNYTSSLPAHITDTIIVCIKERLFNLNEVLKYRFKWSIAILCCLHWFAIGKIVKLDLKRYPQNLKGFMYSQVLLKVKTHAFWNKLTVSHIKYCEEK